jgi:hypothetical protein
LKRANNRTDSTYLHGKSALVSFLLVDLIIVF